jgi:hypothetical protein
MKRLYCAGIGLFGIISTAVILLCLRTPGTEPLSTSLRAATPEDTVLATESEPARDLLELAIHSAPTDSVGPGEYLAENLQWSDIETTLNSVVGNAAVRSDVMLAADKSTNSAFLYLAAMVRLAEAEPMVSLRYFDRIRPTDVPPQFLYGPYRLQLSLRPDQTNPWAVQLQTAVEQKRVSPLIAARFKMHSGDLQGALELYLSTAPAQWTMHDADLLESARLHSGLAPDTADLIQAALQSRQLDPHVATRLNALLDPDVIQSLLVERLHSVFESSGERSSDRTAVEQFAGQQLQLRRLFVERRYSELLARLRGQSPHTLPSETVLLLTLSAASVRDLASFDSWSLELQRRFTSVDVAEWLSQIRADAT